MDGNKLLEWRLALGLSQSEVADAVGVATNTVARWERGELAIGQPNMLRLALERLGMNKRPFPSRLSGKSYHLTVGEVHFTPHAIDCDCGCCGEPDGLWIHDRGVFSLDLVRRHPGEADGPKVIIDRVEGPSIMAAYHNAVMLCAERGWRLDSGIKPEDRGSFT